MFSLVTLLFKISLRNLLRQRRRTLLTLVVMVGGGSGLILIGGFFDNIMRGLREQFIHSQSGHFQVSAPGFYLKGHTDLLNYLLKDARQIQAKVEADPDVELAAPRLTFNGMASTTGASIPVAILGVDPYKEREMGRFQYRDALHPSIHISEGEDLTDDKPFEVLLGKGLLTAMNVRVGDSIGLVTMRSGGAIDGAQFKVRGVFETIMKEVDDRTVKMSLGAARGLLGLKDELHSLVVLVSDTDKAPAIRERLAAGLRQGGYRFEMIPWEQLGAVCIQSEAIFDRVYDSIKVILLIVIFFTIANTINMSLLERLREFGTMMAIGNGRAFILGMIVFEAALLGVAGGILGTLIGSGLAGLISSVGIEMPPPPMGTHPYYAMMELSPRLLAEAFVLVLSSSVLSSLVPAFRMARSRIVQALGYV